MKAAWTASKCFNNCLSCNIAVLQCFKNRDAIPAGTHPYFWDDTDNFLDLLLGNTSWWISTNVARNESQSAEARKLSSLAATITMMVVLVNSARKSLRIGYLVILPRCWEQCRSLTSHHCFWKAIQTFAFRVFYSGFKSWLRESILMQWLTTKTVQECLFL